MIETPFRSAHDGLVKSTHLHVRSQSLSHIKLLVTIRKVTDELRLGMVIKMSSKVVHAPVGLDGQCCGDFRGQSKLEANLREKLSTELAGHILGSMRFNMLLEVFR